jgi:DNA-binding NarL/FixJ family response regulator
MDTRYAVRTPTESPRAHHGPAGGLPAGITGPVRRRILVVDPVTITRECLLHMLGSRPAMSVVEGVASTDMHFGRTPDLVLLNLHSGPHADCALLAQLAAIRACYSHVPIVVIADDDGSRLAFIAFQNEVRGYVPTSLTRDVVIAAIDLVLAGGTFIPQRLLEDWCVPPPVAVPDEPAAQSGDEARLTSRENDVLDRLRQGKPNKIIAYELAISEATVKVHVRNIMKKLHASNRTQVVFMIQTALDSAAPPHPEASAAAVASALGRASFRIGSAGR